MLTVLFALVGWSGVAWGVTRFLRHRRGPESKPQRQGALTAFVVGGAVAFFPDLFAHLVVDPGEGSVILTIIAWLYRVGVVMTMSVLTVVMFLASDYVVVPIARAASRMAAAVPFGPAREARTLRRRGIATDVGPRDWDALVAHNAFLTRQFLDYQRDNERAAEAPWMRDMADPLAAEAARAMFRCDDLRTPAPTTWGGDVLLTPYGRAVTEFDVALRAAVAAHGTPRHREPTVLAVDVVETTVTRRS